MIDDGGPDFGLISNPQQLIRAHLGAVGGFGGSGCGEQLLQTDGDYHRCRYSADGGLILSFEEPGAGRFERIVQPLHLGTFIRDLNNMAVFIFDDAAAGLVSGSKIAFSWAPTVLVSLPCRCHMPSRRCFNST